MSSIICRAQEKPKIIKSDSSYLLSKTMYFQNLNNSKWITCGTQYDFNNHTMGIEISNGYNERPLIHFEDFSEDFIFKLNTKTNFNQNNSYRINLGWINRSFLPFVAIEILYYNYLKKEFKYQDININSEIIIKNSPYALLLKLAYKNLNNQSNIGADIGLRNYLIPQKLYWGISSGYYSNYFTYSGFIQGFIYKNRISINLHYNKIEEYEFINLGLNITLKR